MLFLSTPTDTAILPSKMPRSTNGKSLTFKPVEQYYQSSPSSLSRSNLFSSDAVDISLLSTIFLVLTLLFCAAFFIITLGYLLSNEHDVVVYPPSDGAQSLVWAIRQSTRGCASTC